MKKHQYSLLLNIKTIQVIDKIAKTMDRSRNNMVQHILSKYVVHENGRTSYEMATQHVVNHKVIGFAEKVHFQFNIPREKRNACSNEKSGVGWFVGIVNRSTKYLIASKDGIISCPTVRRLPDNEACDKKCID